MPVFQYGATEMARFTETLAQMATRITNYPALSLLRKVYSSCRQTGEYSDGGNSRSGARGR